LGKNYPFSPSQVQLGKEDYVCFSFPFALGKEDYLRFSFPSCTWEGRFFLSCALYFFLMTYKKSIAFVKDTFPSSTWEGEESR